MKTRGDVRLFSVIVTLVALMGNIGLQHLLLPAELHDRVAHASYIVTVILMAPFSFFIGQRMRDVHDLTNRLEYSVNHDVLTGACTRVSFYERATALAGRPLVVIVTDIDHFKNVNDRFGHKAGDDALRQFTATLARNCRAEDIIARFGGEEFVILLEADGGAQGRAVAQRLGARVRENPLILDGKRLHVTSSFGVAPVPSVARLDLAVHRADLALYRAKEGGRDRVCLYDPEKDGPGQNPADPPPAG
ncbi:GGDEF domain-containing protein [Roseovarius sp. SYSU LYC5161]|uniref:GGDEF domain-containing protein n=1 Tax=Roseovarius halophilus (ex Wu et al. 2025) TaxID=3376060 RepID=UPI00399A247C